MVSPIRVLAAAFILLASAARAQSIEPVQAKPIEPVQAHTIEPAKAHTIEPVEARTIEPVQARTIEPMQAHTLAPVKASTAEPSRSQQVAPRQPAAKSAPADHAAKPAAAQARPVDFVGTWYGTATTVGTIVIKRDGTYEYGGVRAGRWSAKGNEIRFTGALEPWDHGHGVVTNGNLEFYWTTPAGAKQWFSFAK